ncbi:MAG: hypothetical protein NTZ78_02875 [Candidatus Aureabacteria bacterium]|nr:hypothetical protein [Candidatus Auribacterota bacterium]
MKKIITIALSLILMVGLSCVVIAGSLDSPGAPSAGSGMYTLQNLYDYLTSGTALTVQTSFQEPTSGPGSTMKTTKEIGDAVKALFDLCSTTTAANVESGKPFFCTQAGSWGIKTGTAQLAPTPTQTPTQTPTPWGAAACEAKGGKWRATQLGSPDDMGCWFYSTTGGIPCNEVCPAYSLNCLAMNWDDDDSCSICKEFVAGAGCTTRSTDPEGKMPIYYSGGNECYHRPSVSAKDCSANALGSSAEHLLCVCVP